MSATTATSEKTQKKPKPNSTPPLTREWLDDFIGPADNLPPSDTPRPRVNIDENDVGQGLAHLVLTVVKLLHELLERQGMRRMDAGSITTDEQDELGRALHAQAQAIRDTAIKFDIDPDSLNLDLGPLGKVL